MNGKNNKLTWIIFGICFAVMLLAFAVMLGGNPDLGAWILIGAMGVFLLYCIGLLIKSIMATKNPGRTGMVFIGIILAEIAIIGLGIALDLGALGTGIIAAIIVVVGLVIKNDVDNTACPKCGKKFSMKEISRKTISSYATTMNVEQQIKNARGEVTGTYTQTVPATHYTYDCVDECKFCGFRRNVRREATYRD